MAGFRLRLFAHRAESDRRARWPRLRGLAGLLALVVVCTLQACAVALPQAQRTPSHTLPPPPESPLTQLAVSAGTATGESAFWPIPQAAHALDARLAMIRQATRSLDVQVYLLADDSVGRTVLHELREAAARGVRVRLLLDDLYTLDTEPDLAALQDEAGVEVRLFNPFTVGRRHLAGRAFNFIGEFRRLNHRMHNKLFIADGALAIVGGRNLADEYFLRGAQANFVDADVLSAGTLVGDLAAVFDRYWNSEQVFPLQALRSGDEPAAALRERFAARMADPLLTPRIDALDEPDLFGAAPLSQALRGGRQRFIKARAQVVADPPSKAGGLDLGGEAFEQTLSAHYNRTLERASGEIFIFSPYFLPGPQGLQRIRQARDRGVDVKVVTNAVGTSDEPLVNAAYHKYREDLLDLGVQLFEMSSQRSRRDASIRKAFRSSQARLHAKLGFVDRRIVMIGSMNVDMRSAYSNTEIGVGIDSPELARLMMSAYQADTFEGVYQVRRRATGPGLEWVGRTAQGDEVLQEEPEIDLLLRLKLWLQLLFVPEELL